MDKCDLLRVTDREWLSKIHFNPRGGDGRRRVGGRGRGREDGVGDHGRDTAADNIREEVRTIGRVQVDKTIDREADLAGAVPVVGVLDNARCIGRVRKPNAEFLEVTRLAARERQGERAIRRTGREGERHRLLGPALHQGDREGMLGHIKTAGDQVTGILHRHLRKVNRRILEARGDRVRTGRRLADDATEVRKIHLELDRGREHIRREGECTTRQRRAGVGEAEKDIRRTLVGVRPVTDRRKGLATEEEHLLLLARVLAESKRLHKVGRAGNIIELAGTITVSYAAQEGVAPASRKRQANTTTARRNRELHRQDDLRKTLIRVKRNRRTGAAVKRLEALEETVILNRRVALLEGVLLTRVVCVNTLPRPDALLDVKGDLRLHLLYLGHRFSFSLRIV